MTQSHSINIGIDPGGSSGCIAVINDMVTPSECTFFEFSKKPTERDLVLFAQTWRPYSKVMGIRCVMEKVHAMPKQGVVSSFSFGENNGKCKMFAEIVQAETHMVTPRTWQKAIGLVVVKGESKVEHKNRLRQIAERLYPHIKFTNPKVDALLMAHYAKNLI